MRTSSTWLERTRARVVVADKLTYAGNLVSLSAVSGHPRFVFVQADIADRNAVQALFREHRPRWVVNRGRDARRPLDRRALRVPRHQRRRNLRVAEAARGFLAEADAAAAAFRFLHVSTDEVYGSLGPTGLFTETTPYAPNSPYAASKAAADHFVRAYHETFGVPALTTNCSNNYGPYQYPEKLIPLLLLNALDGQPLPIYGDGGNVRDWLYVEDHREAILLALERGRGGERYNVGAHNERTNLEVVEQPVRRPRAGATRRLQPGPGRPRDRAVRRPEDVSARSAGPRPALRHRCLPHATRARLGPAPRLRGRLRRRPCAGTSRTGTGATPCRPDATDVSAARPVAGASLRACYRQADGLM